MPASISSIMPGNITKARVKSGLARRLGSRRNEAVLMTKVCTHGRDKKVAMQMLEQSLRRLQTDHLDVWQIHEVIYDNDPDLIFRSGGAAEALQEAKQQGKVRLIGFTGHKDPSIHLKMLSHGFPFDTVQMPLNPFDATFRSFQQQCSSRSAETRHRVLGMKSLGGSGEMITHGAITVKDALTYAMSLPVATTISGMNSLDILKQNIEIVASSKSSHLLKWQPLKNVAKARLVTDILNFSRPLSNTTAKSDGNSTNIPTAENCQSEIQRIACAILK